MATGKTSYDNQRFKNTRWNSLHSLRDLAKTKIEWLSTTTIAVDSDRNTILKQDYNVITKDYHGPISIGGEWTGDITTRFIDIKNKKFGILDKLVSYPTVPYIQNRWLMLFAFCSVTNNNDMGDGITGEPTVSFNGFGLFQNPKSIASAGAIGVKGATVTITLDSNEYNTAYQFSTGAMILVWYGDRNWNTAKILSINSTTSMTIQYSNRPHGYNVSNADPTIVQWDMFRPYDISDVDKDYNNNWMYITGAIPLWNYGLGSGVQIAPFEYDDRDWTYQDYVAYSDVLSSASTYYDIPTFDFFAPSINIGNILLDSDTNCIVTIKSVISDSTMVIETFSPPGQGGTAFDLVNVHPMIITMASSEAGTTETITVTGAREKL